MEIVPNIYLVPGVIANPYVLIDGEQITLIDTGLPWSKNKILGFIRSLGYSPQSIRNILITHTDLDHVGGLRALQRLSGARVYASAIEASALAEGHPSRPVRRRRGWRGFLMRMMSRMGKPSRVKVDEILSDGQVLPILSGLSIVETPGHTPGHLSYYLPSAGILFTGDSIVSDANGLYASREVVTWDRQKADESVRKQAGLEVKIVCPGHGPVVMDAAGKFPKV